MTDAAKSAKNCSGKVRDASCLAVGQLFDISITESSACVFDRVHCKGESYWGITLGDCDSLVVGYVTCIPFILKPSSSLI